MLKTNVIELKKRTPKELEQKVIELSCEKERYYSELKKLRAALDPILKFKFNDADPQIGRKALIAIEQAQMSFVGKKNEVKGLKEFSVWEYIKMIDEAHEATKGSKLQFT